MIDVLISLYDLIKSIGLEFFQIFSFLYDLMVWFATQFIILSTTASIETTLFMLELSFDIAISLIEELEINQLLFDYYNQIPPVLRSFLDLSGFPVAVQIVLSASVTRFVMGRLGVAL